LGRWLLGVAVLLCLSRVAVGTHYPSDVAAGALLGAGVAAAVWGLRGWVEGPLAGDLGIARRLRLA